MIIRIAQWATLAIIVIVAGYLLIIANNSACQVECSNPSPSPSITSTH